MRINKYVALATGMSRRAADQAITWGRISVNGQPPQSAGYIVQDNDVIALDGKNLEIHTNYTTILLHKPVGYVVSRDGQGSKSIYELLPEAYHTLKTVGRLDKASSGLLLLTNNGDLANKLTHPSYKKDKIYEIELYVPLKTADRQAVERGVMLEDGMSALQLKGEGTNWIVTMSEGRNRQIRRTFGELGYTIKRLHRIQFGDYVLKGTAEGTSRLVSEG